MLLSAGSGSARIHFTEAAFENPQQAPMFCMLLRKHLTGARILSLTQPDLERMVVLELDTPLSEEMLIQMRAMRDIQDATFLARREP